MLLNNKNDTRSFLEQTAFYDGQLSKADTHGWTVVLFFFLSLFSVLYSVARMGREWKGFPRGKGKTIRILRSLRKSKL